MKTFHDGKTDDDTMFYMPRLEVADAKEFGHDGLGHYSGNYGEIPKGVEQVSLIQTLDTNSEPSTINHTQ